MFIYQRTPEALNSQTQPRMGVSAHAGQAWVHLGGQMTIHWPASSGNTVPAPRRAAERGPFSHVRRASDAAWRGFFFSTASLDLWAHGAAGRSPGKACDRQMACLPAHDPRTCHSVLSDLGKSTEGCISILCTGLGASPHRKLRPPGDLNIWATILSLCLPPSTVAGGHGI